MQRSGLGGNGMSEANSLVACQTSKDRKQSRFWEHLGVQVIGGMILGVGIGLLAPSLGLELKILGDIFLRLIKTVIAPLVFLSVVMGIISGGDIRKVGRVSLVSFVYFEVISLVALAIGFVSANWFEVGSGVHAAVEAPSVAAAQAAAHPPTINSFILNIFPDNFVAAFTKNELLQVLVIALIFAVAIMRLPSARRAPIEGGIKALSEAVFQFIEIVMKFAPLGAFGAIAFTVASSGSGVVWALAYFVFIYWTTVALFIFVIFGIVLCIGAVNLFELFRFLRSEVLIALGTASSESVLPRLFEKLEMLGCSKQTVGLVLPLGYAFNLDGTAIYMPMGVVFIANAYGVHLSFEQQLGICALMMLTSKGAATVSGGTFVVFAATIATAGVLPLSGLALLFGVLRLQAPMTVLCNVVGNCVATIVTATFCGEFDAAKARRALLEEADSQ